MMPVISHDAALGVPQRLPEFRCRTLFESYSASSFLSQQLNGRNAIPLIYMDLSRFTPNIMTAVTSTQSVPGRIANNPVAAGMKAF